MDAAQVVGADQHHRRLGPDAVKLAVLHAPQQVPGVVAAEAEVDRVAVPVEALPNRGEVLPIRRPALFPVLGDAVPQP